MVTVRTAHLQTTETTKSQAEVADDGTPTATVVVGGLAAVILLIMMIIVIVIFCSDCLRRLKR